MLDGIGFGLGRGFAGAVVATGGCRCRSPIGLGRCLVVGSVVGAVEQALARAADAVALRGVVAAGVDLGFLAVVGNDCSSLGNAVAFVCSAEPVVPDVQMLVEAEFAMRDAVQHKGIEPVVQGLVDCAVDSGGAVYFAAQDAVVRVDVGLGLVDVAHSAVDKLFDGLRRCLFLALNVLAAV